MLISHKGSDESIFKIFSKIPKELTEKSSINKKISFFINYILIVNVTILLPKLLHLTYLLMLQDLPIAFDI